MKTNYYLILLLATLCLSATPVHAQGNLVVNGSFEANGGSFNGWNMTSFEQGFTIGGSNALSAVTIPIPDGNNFAFYQANLDSQIGYNNPGFYTFINTSAGAYYDLSFSAIAFDGTNSASVSINGSLLAALNFTTTVPVRTVYNGEVNSVWQNFNFIFQATSSIGTILTFNYSAQSIGVPDEDNPYEIDSYFGAGGFDNISVTLVPEPSPVALLGMGLAGVFICRRLIRLKHENWPCLGFVDYQSVSV
jgi:PEP-CTERM motif